MMTQSLAMWMHTESVWIALPWLLLVIGIVAVFILLTPFLETAYKQFLEEEEEEEVVGGADAEREPAAGEAVDGLASKRVLGTRAASRKK